MTPAEIQHYNSKRESYRSREFFFPSFGPKFPQIFEIRHPMRLGVRADTLGVRENRENIQIRGYLHSESIFFVSLSNKGVMNSVPFRQKIIR